MPLRQRVHEVLEVAAPGDHLSRAFDIFMLALIVLNIIALVVETVVPIYEAAPAFFEGFEAVSIAIFSVEYLLRLWSCTVEEGYEGPVRGRLRYARSPLAVIDLLAVLPFYLPFVGVDLRFLRALRLFRLFRLAKLARYSRALNTLGRVVLAKKEELITTLFSVLPNIPSWAAMVVTSLFDWAFGRLLAQSA